MFDPRTCLRCLLLPILALAGGCDKAGEGTGTGETGTANETGESGGGLCGEVTTTLITDLDTPPPTFDESVNELLAEVIEPGLDVLFGDAQLVFDPLAAGHFDGQVPGSSCELVSSVGQLSVEPLDVAVVA